MDSVQNVGAPLANTVSGWWGCSLQVGSYILCLLAQRSSDTSELVSNVPTVQDDQFPALNAGTFLWFAQPPLHRALAYGGVKVTVEILAQCFKKQEPVREI